MFSRISRKALTRVVAGVAFLASAFIVFQPSQSEAGSVETVWRYYSDDSFSANVGYRKKSCSGSTTSTGQTTAYYRVCYYSCYSPDYEMPDEGIECYECTPDGCVDY